MEVGYFHNYSMYKSISSSPLPTIVLLALFHLGTNHLFSEDIVFDSKGFEELPLKCLPVGWKPFHAPSHPSVHVAHGGAFGSKKCLRIVRSKSGGWTSLSRKFKEPQKRISIEFSFAFSHSKGRTLNLWTHEPGGKDASQFNICIQNGSLQQYDGRTKTWELITKDIVATRDPTKPVWHRFRAIVDAQSKGIDFWISKPHMETFPTQAITRHAYRTGLPLGAIDIVSGTRIAAKAWYLIDDLKITGGDSLPAPGKVQPLPAPFPLWSGKEIPKDVKNIPFVAGVQHSTIHRATQDGYKFLHGAAIIAYKGTLFAHWANSPTNENGPHETLQGRRSKDGGQTWSDLEMIGPGYKGLDRHSHGVFMIHQDRLWVICSKFGMGVPGRRFPGLHSEAFVLNEKTNKWDWKGPVMKNCWPFDEPVPLSNGNFATGGMNKDGYPVVAISEGKNILKWNTIPIPFPVQLKPSFAETSIWGKGKELLAVIRGGGNRAWVSTSKNSGKTWAQAQPSNLPMPRAKAYLGHLSTKQLFLISNLNDRHTLIVSVSQPGKTTLSKMWKIRSGKSIPPRFPGKAKSKQWSYPFGYEHNGKLYVVYSIGKEDCGLSIIPLKSLMI